MSNEHSPGLSAPATRREIFAWAMFDFANSGYTTVVLTAIFNAYFVGVVTTVVLTAIFNAYFVGVVAGNGQDHDGTATLLWTLATGIANVLVLLSAPVVGAVADHGGKKKAFLLVSTAGCVLFTALLALVGPGEVALGMLLLVLSAFMFHTGEDLIAGFLPEIADRRAVRVPPSTCRSRCSLPPRRSRSPRFLPSCGCTSVPCRGRCRPWLRRCAPALHACAPRSNMHITTATCSAF
ncbi:MAG: transporter [Proteobacteria bacterium]|nr:transporter [Pseudomonadota bacterium]